MKTYIIALDVAESEFDRFADAMDIDYDTDAMDEEDADSFRGLRKKVVRAIQLGALIINDKDEPVLTVETEGGAKQITFSEPTGSTLMATDGGKKNAHVASLNRMMADITKQPPAFFARMRAREHKVCTAITTLFLA